MSTKRPPAEPGADRSAWAMLQRARPQVEWHRQSLRGADLTGSGETTRVMVGSDDEGTTWLGLVRPVREGPLNPGVFAVAPVISLSFEKLERTEDWLVDGAFPLAGCRPRRGMHLLRVVATQTREVTLLYWNVEGRRFDTWISPAAAPVEPPQAYEDPESTG
jgi:hypothetical protein